MKIREVLLLRERLDSSYNELKWAYGNLCEVGDFDFEVRQLDAIKRKVEIKLKSIDDSLSSTEISL